jgi:hypothetical protein
MSSVNDEKIASKRQTSNVLHEKKRRHRWERFSRKLTEENITDLTIYPSACTTEPKMSNNVKIPAYHHTRTKH